MKKLALAALAVLLLCACASPALAEWQDRYLSQDSAVFDRAFAQEALKLSTLIYYRDQQAAYMRKAGFNTVGYWNFHRPAGDTRHICAYYVYQKALPDGRMAVLTAHEMGIPVTAGFHLQPENVLYSAGPLRYIPGASAFIYWLFDRMLYRHIRHIHTPSHMIAAQLRAHGYRQRLHVISNGYSPRFTAKQQREPGSPSPRPFRIVASGRLASEKDHVTLIRAVALSRHAEDIELSICGTGPLQHELRRMAAQLLPGRWSIGFHDNAQMPAFLRSCDLLVHPSIVDIESLSVLEGMASGLVPVIARSTQSAAGQFALCDHSLFEAQDPAMLAQRIDWWIDHPDELSRWGAIYAEHTREEYSIASCVRKFVAMEREAIADFDGRL